MKPKGTEAGLARRWQSVKRFADLFLKDGVLEDLRKLGVKN
jgi:hypothetical protein